MAPEQGDGADRAEDDAAETIDPTICLMYLANEGNLEGIEELQDQGTDVNISDMDGRTALHVAACQGSAEIDVTDRWGSTPLANAIYYKKQDVIKLLEKHGAKPLGTFCSARWRGIQVAVKKLKGDLRAFLKVKGALKPTLAIKFALDIASG